MARHVFSYDDAALEAHLIAYEESVIEAVERRDEILLAAVFEVVTGLAYPTAVLIGTYGSLSLLKAVFGVEGWTGMAISALIGTASFFAAAFHIEGVKARVRSKMPELPRWRTSGDDAHV